MWKNIRVSKNIGMVVYLKGNQKISLVVVMKTSKRKIKD